MKKTYSAIAALCGTALLLCGCYEKVHTPVNKTDKEKQEDTGFSNQNTVMIDEKEYDFKTGKLKEIDGLSSSLDVQFGTCVLNLEDVATLRSMSALTSLDLSHVSFVEGEIYSAYATDITTEKNVVPQEFIYSMPALESVTMPASAVKIDAHNFYRCSNLKEIKIGNSVKDIGRYCFFDLPSLQELTIPDSVETIYDGFTDMIALTKLTLGKNLTSFAPNLTIKNLKEIVIRSRKIGISKLNKFNYCPNLEKFTFEGDCDNLMTENGNILMTKDKEVLHFFPAARKVSDLTGPATRCYGSYTFTSFTGDSFTLPEGVEEIWIHTMSRCKVKKMVLPSTFKKIGSYGLFGAEIGELVIHATTPPAVESNGISNGTFSKVIVPKGTFSSYKAAEGWKNLTTITESDSF